MLILRRRNELITSIGNLKHVRKLSASNLPALQDEDYTTEPQYPKIEDPSFRAKKQRQLEKWHEEIRSTPTVEEKLIKVNMPRYYGYKVVQMSDEKFPYNILPAIQHYTRTVFEKLGEPKQADASEISKDSKQHQINSLVKSIKSEVQDALEFTSDYVGQSLSYNELEPVEQERLFTQTIIEQINRVLTNALSADYQHLSELEVDLNPRHEAFWQVGGIDAPRNVVKAKEGREWQKAMAKDPVDRLFQYTGSPYLAARHRKQLQPFKTEAESKNSERAKQLPQFRYDPRTLGFTTEYKHLTNIPGYWPGSPSGFGFLSYQSRAHLQNRPDSFGAEDFKEVLDAQAILSSYAWLLAQANYNGFNTYNDLTYPMNTQTILTNGRTWSFYEYQLNTLLVHSHHIDENPFVNFCRGTPEMELFQEFDKNGKCVGFNDDVLKYIIQFYTNVPTVERNAAQSQPFLHAQYKHASDYPDAEKRIFLDKTFKYLCSNRPRHLEIPEIYLWEKIYKIDNKTRIMDAKRRFFEVGVNPWKRTLDQHQKEYIPRCVRANGPRDKKNKWKPTFYPKQEQS